MYDELFYYDNLLLAYRKARKNKTAKWYVHKFEKDLKKNLTKLEAELKTETYIPHSLKNFVIRDQFFRCPECNHLQEAQK